MSSSGDEAPDDITFETSKKDALRKKKIIKGEIIKFESQQREKITKRQQLYKEQKEKKRLDLKILEQANKEITDRAHSNEKVEAENEVVRFSSSDEEDDDSGINLQIKQVKEKKNPQLYQDAMNFKRKMLYGKRINRITPQEKKIMKSKQTQKRKRTA